MSKDTTVEEKMLEPAGQALRRIVQDEKFRDAVADDAGRALEGYDLTPEATSALVEDAKALSSEVSGFASGPGLKTPGIMGIEIGDFWGPSTKLGKDGKCGEGKCGKD